MMWLSTIGLSSCINTTAVEPPAIAGQDVRFTILHTSDLHSRLMPYQFEPSFTDRSLGLGVGDQDDDGLDDAGPFGGIAKIGAILERETTPSHTGSQSNSMHSIYRSFLLCQSVSRVL